MQYQRPGIRSLIVGFLLATVVISYPFLIYSYIDILSPAAFAGLLLLLIVIRFVVLNKKPQKSDIAMLTVMSVFCACAIWLNSESLLRFYPVLMNVGIGLVFLTSLYGDECLIARFAKLSGKAPPAAATGYLRTLTLLWSLLLFLNGAISAYTAWYTDLSTWALYNGFIAYAVMAIFALGELLYRRQYKKKHNIIDD